MPQARACVNPPSHLPLGVTVVEMALDYSKRQPAEATVCENVSRSADYADPIPPSSSRRAPRASASSCGSATAGEVPPWLGGRYGLARVVPLAW